MGSNEFSLIYRFKRNPSVSIPRGPIPCSEPGYGLGESRSTKYSPDVPCFNFGRVFEKLNVNRFYMFVISLYL